MLSYMHGTPTISSNNKKNVLEEKQRSAADGSSQKYAKSDCVICGSHSDNSGNYVRTPSASSTSMVYVSRHSDCLSLDSVWLQKMKRCKT